MFIPVSILSDKEDWATAGNLWWWASEQALFGHKNAWLNSRIHIYTVCAHKHCYYTNVLLLNVQLIHVSRVVQNAPGVCTPPTNLCGEMNTASLYTSAWSLLKTKNQATKSATFHAFDMHSFSMYLYIHYARMSLSTYTCIFNFGLSISISSLVPRFDWIHIYLDVGRCCRVVP